MSISNEIASRCRQAGARFHANDNISQHIKEGELDLLIAELAPKFEAVLDGLVIDRFTDPNSMDTGKRLAKMYINEIMAGRYNSIPNATAFPNHVEDGYEGMLILQERSKEQRAQRTLESIFKQRMAVVRIEALWLQVV